MNMKHFIYIIRCFIINIISVIKYNLQASLLEENRSFKKKTSVESQIFSIIIFSSDEICLFVRKGYLL
uniref:Uncharacterized protein n=1 Tax=Heterorhabditis bacteriophora TaxID=37862 RepID=A0A1I7W9C7_HETBA